MQFLFIYFQISIIQSKFTLDRNNKFCADQLIREDDVSSLLSFVKKREFSCNHRMIHRIIIEMEILIQKHPQNCGNTLL